MRALLCSLALLLLPAHNSSTPVTREVFLMGTSCTLTIFAEDRAKTLDAIEQGIRVLENTEKELSTWQKGSLLTALNQQPVGKPFALNPSLCRLLTRLQHWTSETGGAFDPGIGALINAWGLRSGGRYPLDSEIKEARRRSGFHLYTIDSQPCRLTRIADVMIDCGAFGKGEALERLYSIEHLKASAWMVNFGGQIAVKGTPPGADGWEVQIAHPSLRDKPAMHIRMDSGSLATSSGSERDLQVSGRRVGHILDPRTGYPAEFSGSASVWHESALIADILSTALYVMGPDEGLSWAEARNIAACYLIALPSGTEIKATRIFQKRFPNKAKPIGM